MRINELAFISFRIHFCVTELCKMCIFNCFVVLRSNIDNCNFSCFHVTLCNASRVFSMNSINLVDLYLNYFHLFSMSPM